MNQPAVCIIFVDVKDDFDNVIQLSQTSYILLKQNSNKKTLWKCGLCNKRLILSLCRGNNLKKSEARVPFITHFIYIVYIEESQKTKLLEL